VVVLPTPPFWLEMDTILLMVEIRSHLIPP